MKRFIVPICWLSLGVSIGGVSPAGDAGRLRKHFIISAHRAGGRTHAPDNSMPNILFAIAQGFTAIEIDLQLTRDGRLILWHDSTFPGHYELQSAVSSVRWNQATLYEIRAIRYSTHQCRRQWNGLRVVTADELVRVAKGKINLHLDVKGCPAERVIAFIRRHGIQKQCMVMSRDISYLTRIRSAEPDVCLEYCDNLLGRREVGGKWQWYAVEMQHRLYHELMRELAAEGIDALCTKGLTREKVAICHQYGIMVRTSASNMKPGVEPDRYLRMGVDYALTDDPVRCRQAVERLLGRKAVSERGKTFFELVRVPRTSGAR